MPHIPLDYVVLNNHINYVFAKQLNQLSMAETAILLHFVTKNSALSK
jgi:hypothetical protein